MKIKSSLLVIFITTAILSSCGLKGLKGIKVPADKMSYVGFWSSDNMMLQIDESGYVNYKRQNGGTSKSINAPIQKFDGNNFVVGALGINTTFVVSDPPHQDSLGNWFMTVDGVELRRRN